MSGTRPGSCSALTRSVPCRGALGCSCAGWYPTWLDGATIVCRSEPRRARVSGKPSDRRWTDVDDAGDAGVIWVTVRRGKTNHADETNDVRYLKSDPARAARALRAATVERGAVARYL